MDAYYEIRLKCRHCRQPLPLAEVGISEIGRLLVIVRCMECQITTSDEITAEELAQYCREDQHEPVESPWWEATAPAKTIFH